jgi:hypothetical protein
MLKHLVQTNEVDVPAFDVSRNAWNNDHKFDGGLDGQVPIRDSALDATTGARYGWMMPAEAYTSDAQIPINQGGWVITGLSPNRVIALRFNDNGFVRTITSITF